MTESDGENPKPSENTTVLTAASSQLDKQLETLTTQRDIIRALARRVRVLPHNKPLTFEVVMVSMWADDNEPGVTVKMTGTLGEVMNAAIQKFMQQNRRSDVQAHYHVYLVLPPRRKPHTAWFRVSLPESIWSKYKWKAKE